MPQRRILLVCTGDNCREILARAVACHEDKQQKFKFESASCTLNAECTDIVPAEPKVHPDVLTAVRKVLGSEEYELLKDYQPRRLTVDLVKEMDRIYFLCFECMENAKRIIPSKYHNKMRYYCTYTNNLTSMECHDVPNPIAASVSDSRAHWKDYYKTEAFSDTLTNCKTVLASIQKDFQPRFKADLEKDWP